MDVSTMFYICRYCVFTLWGINTPVMSQTGISMIKIFMTLFSHFVVWSCRPKSRLTHHSSHVHNFSYILHMGLSLLRLDEATTNLDKKLFFLNFSTGMSETITFLFCFFLKISIISYIHHTFFSETSAHQKWFCSWSLNVVNNSLFNTLFSAYWRCRRIRVYDSGRNMSGRRQYLRRVHAAKARDWWLDCFWR